jgi:hypothetical protein
MPAGRCPSCGNEPVSSVDHRRITNVSEAGGIRWKVQRGWLSVSPAFVSTLLGLGKPGERVVFSRGNRLPFCFINRKEIYNVWVGIALLRVGAIMSAHLFLGHEVCHLCIPWLFINHYWGRSFY